MPDVPDVPDPTLPTQAGADSPGSAPPDPIDGDATLREPTGFGDAPAPIAERPGGAGASNP